MRRRGYPLAVPRERDFDFEVGESATLKRIIRAEDVTAFAELTGDVNPVHVDEEYAAGLGIGGRVAHGMLTAGYVSTVIGTMLPGHGALWLSQRFRFRAPVHIGDEISVTVAVRHVSTSTQILGLDVRVENQRGRLVLDGDAQVQLLDKVNLVSAEQQEIRTAVVTGAGRGIGAAVAARLAADGLSVVVNYREGRAEAEETAQKISDSGGQVTVFQADVTDPDEATALIEHGVEAFGQVDALVNNAGGPMSPKELSETDWEDVQAHLGSHLRAGFLCSQAALPGMMDRGFGRIVNVTSESAYGSPPAKLTGYVVAKAALAAYTRCLAVEVGPRGVTANAVAPGMTDTRMVADVPQRAKLGLAAQAPLRRLGSTEDVADVVSFLLGAGGSYVTGQTIHVSGGQFIP
jgi:3-oxoacyl-[acyl-carrier protein] reductase